MKNEEDYKNNMKGKLKSYLSCIPEVVCFDIVPNDDDFIILSTDGIFDALNLKKVVKFMQIQINYITDKALNLQKDENPNKIVNSLLENCKIMNS